MSERPRIKYTIPKGAPMSRCKGPNCGAPMYWIETATGRRLPVDADGIPHWATCPDRALFTKPRERKGGRA